ncbi:hypothetical protein HAP94_13915 [Acidithiobacillus ferrivorans]|nr:hypothetical protein [Acidithiobacillus ferrivorans]
MTAEQTNIQDMSADELKQEIQRQRLVACDANRTVALCNNLLAGKTGQIQIGDKVRDDDGNLWVITQVHCLGNCRNNRWRYKGRKCEPDGTLDDFNSEIWSTPLVRVEN